jgi:predicted lysophospholipase L1 biosynthesis ABC-type transport system permease subunit
LVLMGVVALVLLISCANVANLVLARNLSRQQELGVRLALGAGRGRIVSQLMTESLLIAITGAALGMVLATWGSRLLLGLLPASRIPWAFDLRPDPTIVTLGSLAGVITAVLFGAGPALRACRAAADRITTGSSRVTQRGIAGKLLVSGQLALSLVLAGGGGIVSDDAVQSSRTRNSASARSEPGRPISRIRAAPPTIAKRKACGRS